MNPLDINAEVATAMSLVCMSNEYANEALKEQDIDPDSIIALFDFLDNVQLTTENEIKQKYLSIFTIGIQLGFQIAKNREELPVTHDRNGN